MLLMPRETGAPRQNLQHSRENRQTPHERVESVQTHAAFALIPHYETPSHYTAFFPNHYLPIFLHLGSSMLRPWPSRKLQLLAQLLFSSSSSTNSRSTCFNSNTRLLR